MKRGRLVALAALLAAAVFAWLTFRRVEWRSVRSQLVALPAWAFLLALALKGAAFASMAARSRVLLQPLRPPPFWALYRSLLLGFVGNNLLPMRVGELLRVGYLARRGGLPVAGCLSALALERTLDVLCLLALCAGVLPGLLALPLTPALAALAALALTAAGLAIAVAWRPGPFLGAVERGARALPDRARRAVRARALELVSGVAALASGGGLLASLAWTLAYWSCMSAGVAVWLHAFGFSLPAAAPLVVLLFVSLGALLPIPGQIGSYHFFAAAALGTLGVEGGRAASFALVLHFMSFVPFTLLGIAVATGEWGAGGRWLRFPGRAYDPSA